MKPFRLSLSTLMLRFYLMMAVVIVAGFTGQWLFAFLALPIFLSCLLAVGFTFRRKQGSTTETQHVGGRRVSHRHAQAPHAA